MTGMALNLYGDVIFVGSKDNKVYAFATSDGTKAWETVPTTGDVSVVNIAH